MKPPPFDYHAPSTVTEAVGLLDQLDEAKVIAGGQSLAPLLNLRLTGFDHLIDLRRLDELRGIEHRGDALWIGAAATQRAVERSALVADAVPLLSRAMPLIGHFQIRNRGTVGGSAAHADPSAEIPAVALTLDASIEATSSRGPRVIAATDFFTGFWSTALADDELLTAVSFPVWTGRCGFAIEEVARRHGDFAMAGAAVAVELADDASVVRCAIGLFGLGSTPVRATASERAVVGVQAAQLDTAGLGRDAVADLDGIPSDLNGSAPYRRRIGATTVARALGRALEEALHV